MDDRPGCFSGLLKLFFLRTGYDWAQRNFGYKRGGCMGCGCGMILFIVFVIAFFSIVFGTSWTDFRFFVPQLWMM